MELNIIRMQEIISRIENTFSKDDVPVDSADEMIRLIEAIRKASEPTFQTT